MNRLLAWSLLVIPLATAAAEEPPPTKPQKPLGAFFDVSSSSSSAPGQAPMVEWVDSFSREGGFVFGAPGPSLTLEPLDEATRTQLPAMPGRGLVASSVREGGPAWEAGIRPQDVLVSMNSQPLNEPDDLDRLLKKAGDEPATLAVVRKRKPVELKVRARIQVEVGPAIDEEPKRWIGASVEPIPSVLRTQLELPENQGLAITRLVDGAPAAKAGLKVHDVILAVDDTLVADGPALIESVGKAGDKPVSVEILRAGERRTLTVTPEKRPAQGLAVHDSKWQTVTFVDLPRAGVVVGETPNEHRFVVASPRANSTEAAIAEKKDQLDAMAAELKSVRESIESLNFKIHEQLQKKR